LLSKGSFNYNNHYTLKIRTPFYDGDFREDVKIYIEVFSYFKNY